MSFVVDVPIYVYDIPQKVDVNSCEDVVRVAVACWPNVKIRGCRSKELNYLFSGKYIC